MNTEENKSSEAEVKDGVARLYEIVDKVTGEVIPVEKLGSGDVDNDQDADFVVHKADGTEIVFKREGQNEDGAIFVNEQYLVRDRETKTAPNGVTPVADVIPEEGKADESNDAEAGAEGEKSADEGAEEKADESKADEGAGESNSTASEFAVFGPDGAFLRAYNSVDHGDKAEELAKQFAEKVGGTVGNN